MTYIDPKLDPALPLALLNACPAYKPTPMTRHVVDHRQVWLKDETDRMGLGAFKALGGVYAVARILQGMTGGADLASPAARAAASAVTFVCASAGNHGMAVAAGARLFGARCRVHLSNTVPDSFARRLREKGAEVVRSGDTYEDSVSAAIADAKATGAVHLADGSWPGYTEPPRLVMEGYTVIAEELRAAFHEHQEWPTHVYLQAGVGGLAAAIAYMIRQNWPVQPEITVVEPDAAPCLQRSVAEGRIVTVEGPASTMGRLDCKTPSLLAFDLLRKTADRFVAVTDAEAEAAVQAVARLGIATTPSGAAGMAAMRRDALAPDTKALIILSERAVADPGIRRKEGRAPDWPDFRPSAVGPEANP